MYASKIIVFAWILMACLSSTDCAPAYKIYKECNSTGIKNGLNNFTICGFKIGSSYNLNSVDDVYTRYAAVSADIFSVGENTETGGEMHRLGHFLSH